MKSHSLPKAAVSLSLFALLLMLLPEEVSQAGEMLVHNPLRLNGLNLISGHFAHWSWNHFFWDGCVFLGLAAAYETGFLLSPANNRSLELLLAVLFGGVLISAGLLLSTPDFHSYRGLSGLCTMLYVMLALDWRKTAAALEDRRNMRFAELAIALLFLKVAFEIVAGGALFVNASEDGYHVVVEAHLFGALAGFASETLLVPGPDPCPERSIPK